MSFEQLVSTHTNGQIILLMAGFSVLDDIRQKAIEEVTGKPPKQSAQTGPSEKKIRPKLKDIKKMSVAEHKRFYDSIGQGLF